MKQLLACFFTLYTFNLTAQQMKTPEESIIQLFVSTDRQEWSQVEAVFSDKVELDYSSLTGSPVTELAPSDIVESWKGILPGFSHTHHQLGNFQSIIENETANVFCYGTAHHYLEDNNGNVWVVVGSYDFKLIQVNYEWKITSMKFNYKFQDGNSALPEKAMNKLK